MLKRPVTCPIKQSSLSNKTDVKTYTTPEKQKLQGILDTTYQPFSSFIELQGINKGSQTTYAPDF